MISIFRRHPVWAVAPLLLVLGFAAAAWARRASSGAPASPVAAGEVAGEQAPPYRLEVHGWEGPVSEEGYLLVVVEARAPFKLNTDYPLRLRFAAPPEGLELPQRRFELSDAQIQQRRRLTFTVPVLAHRAGQYLARATLRLGVCTERQCRRDKRSLEIGVVAQ